MQIGKRQRYNATTKEWDETPIHLKDERRFQPIHLIGKTSTGKTAAMLDWAYQDIRDGHGICFIDPRGDAVPQLIGHIPKDRWDDVVLLDFSDYEFPVGLNIFDRIHPDRWDFVTQ